MTVSMPGGFSDEGQRQLDGDFKKILEAARARKGCPGVVTTIVANHLAQMRLFGLRQGVEFYPRKDNYGFRRIFLEQLVEGNELDARLERVMDDLIIDGKGLWFFRPIGDSYRILWFKHNCYKAYYDLAGHIEVLEMAYSFKAPRKNFSQGFANNAPMRGINIGGAPEKKWIRIRVTKESITEQIGTTKPDLDVPFDNILGGAQEPKRTLVNGLGFVPAIEAFNVLDGEGQDSPGDFDEFAEHILVHNDIVSDIASNVGFYGTPTLLSSRPRRDLTEARDDTAVNARPSLRAGFRPAGDARGGGMVLSTRASRSLGRERVPRIISNLEPNDRVGYISPAAVSSDQLNFAKMFREEVRTGLGGVDELGLSSGATATEIRSLFGRAAATAARKCRALFDYGLCKLLAMLIAHEERIFRESFAAAIELPMPEPPVIEQMREEMGEEFTDELYQDAVSKYEEDFAAWEGALQDEIQLAIENQEIPAGVVGLIPDGDPRVEWRHRGPVFEESARDMLNNTIICRNLQELGVGSIDALRHIFPNKTPEELSAMLSGFPFRVVSETQRSIEALIGLVDRMRSVPHPQRLDVPLIADARLDLTPTLYRALDSLKRELSHGSSAGPGAADGHGPAELTALERARVQRGLPADDGAGPDDAEFRPDAPGGALADGPQRMGGGSAADQRIDRDAPVPVPGSVLSADPVDAAAVLRQRSSMGPAPSDALAATSADLLAGTPSAYRSAADSLRSAGRAAGQRARS